MPIPKRRSKNVGELLGILAALVELVDVVLVDALLGSGLTWSAKTSNRLSAVPRGVHVSSVIIGFDVGIVNAATSVGLTTFFPVT